MKKFAFFVACVAGGISRVRAFVLVAKPWTRVAKPWEDWWRVQLNSRLPKFVGFFELCVHQWTRISDWLRVPKRQSSVNLYLSSFPGEKVCFIHWFAMDNAKKCKEEALNSLNIRWKSRKIMEMAEQERAVRVDLGEWCEMGLTSLHDFEILRFVTYVDLPFSVGSLDIFVASLVFMKGTSSCVIRRNLK